ncbi:Uncharacterised protein [Bergeyella zoohelcum]|uniref:Uncharacterized protein n=1 Tax=Bergeyella zoohelcum TaxID=1015 RepID=A0A7Z9CHN1_9FLAO|nr:Uncharacterised protein [Bergeyella zoohelcum]
MDIFREYIMPVVVTGLSSLIAGSIREKQTES